MIAINIGCPVGWQIELLDASATGLPSEKTLAAPLVNLAVLHVDPSGNGQPEMLKIVWRV